MRIVWTIVFVLTTLLGVSTGAVKLAQMAEEMEIFRQAGVPDAVTMGFGAVQLLAALAMLPPRSRKAGAATLALSFVLATGVLFLNGLVVFGLVSLLFPAMALFVGWGRPTP